MPEIVERRPALSPIDSIRALALQVRRALEGKEGTADSVVILSRLAHLEDLAAGLVRDTRAALISLDNVLPDGDKAVAILYDLGKSNWEVWRHSTELAESLVGDHNLDFLAVGKEMWHLVGTQAETLFPNLSARDLDAAPAPPGRVRRARRSATFTPPAISRRRASRAEPLSDERGSGWRRSLAPRGARGEGAAWVGVVERGQARGCAARNDSTRRLAETCV